MSGECLRLKTRHHPTRPWSRTLSADLRHLLLEVDVAGEEMVIWNVNFVSFIGDRCSAADGVTRVRPDRPEQRIV